MDLNVLRERALYSAVNLHCETGDAMVVLDRQTAAADVLATAQEFYDWITQPPDRKGYAADKLVMDERTDQ